MKKIHLISLFLGGIIIPSLSAFAATNPLTNTKWDLVSFDGTGAIGSVSFDSSTMHSSFCNQVNQGYVMSGSTLTASGAGMSTMMYCEGLPMTLEENFSINPAATISLSGTTYLNIKTASGHVFEFQKAAKMCTKEYRPVCGEDNITYSNACMAEAPIAYPGKCETDPKEATLRKEYGAMFEFAKIYGITSANSLTEFRVHDTVKREEAAKMLSALAANVYEKRYASFPDECNVRYLDEKSFVPELKNTIYESCALGIMKGNKGNFDAKKGLSRAEALAAIMRIVDGVQDEKSTPWWINYADRSYKLGLFSFANFKGFDNSITRGEFLSWMYIFSKEKQK